MKTGLWVGTDWQLEIPLENQLPGSCWSSCGGMEDKEGAGSAWSFAHLDSAFEESDQVVRESSKL